MSSSKSVSIHSQVQYASGRLQIMRWSYQHFPNSRGSSAIFTVNVTVITTIPPTCCCGCETLGLGRFGSPETTVFAWRLSHLLELPPLLLSDNSQFEYQTCWPVISSMFVCLAKRLPAGTRDVCLQFVDHIYVQYSSIRIQAGPTLWSGHPLICVPTLNLHASLLLLLLLPLRPSSCSSCTRKGKYVCPHQPASWCHLHWTHRITCVNKATIYWIVLFTSAVKDMKISLSSFPNCRGVFYNSYRVMN